MSCYYIIGVRMDNRIDNAVKFQEVLTKTAAGSRRAWDCMR